MDELTCKTCNQTKPTTEFPKDHRNKSGFNTRCRACENARRNAKRKPRFHRTVEQLGMTRETYNAMLIEQEGVCAICGTPPTHNRALCVDHCHATNKIRGLLCDKCNRILGQFNDDPALFSKAADYLS